MRTITFVGGPFTHGGTGVDGAVVFDGVNPVPHTTLAGSTYTLTADINATDATIQSGVTVEEANWEIFCSGAFDLQSGGILHNSGGDGVNGGNGTGFVLGGGPGAGGTAANNSTNPTHAGSLLSGAPGYASAGGTGADPDIGGGADSTAPTDGHIGLVAGGTGGLGGVVPTPPGPAGTNANATIPGIGRYQGGGGGGGGQRSLFGGWGYGGGGASAGGDAGPVRVSAATMAIAGTIRANGGLQAVGGNGGNATSSHGGGGGGGGGSLGGRPGPITLRSGTFPVITGTVEAIGQDTVLGAGGARGLGDGAADGLDGHGRGGSPYDAGYAIEIYGSTVRIGHGANLNAYDNGGALSPIFPPGNGELIEDIEPLRNWCRANGISVALCQDSQRSCKDMLDELLTIGNSAPVYSGDKLKIIPYDEVSSAGNGAVFTSPTASGPVADLTDKDFVSDGKTPPIKFSRKRRASCDNVVAIEHIDRSLDYAHSITTDYNASSVALNGPRKGGTLDAATLGVKPSSGSRSLLSIHSAEVAQKISSILAKRGATAPEEYSFTLKSEWLHLEAMDLVTVSDSRLGLSAVPVRLTSAKEDDKRQLECTGVRFIYGLNHPDVRDNTTATGTLVSVNVDPGSVNDPIIFEPPAGMLAGGNPQVWILVSGADENYGGCVAFVSVDGGSTYSALGTIGPGTTGTLTGDYPDSASDPDTTNTLAVDLTESLGELSSQSQAIADGFADPCFVGVEASPASTAFEVVCPTVATLTSAENYSMDTYIRRAVQGTSHMDHPTGSRFGVLDAATFKIDLPSQWAGITIHMKFAAYNKVGGQQQSLADCTDYTFTPSGVFLPGGFYINGN